MAKEEFNMSAAIREVFATNPKATSSEAMDAITAKYPKQAINKNSFSVGFYTIRRKMGGKSTRKSVRGHRPARATGGHVSDGKVAVSFEALKHAANLVREVGSIEAAMAALKAVSAVQIS